MAFTYKSAHEPPAPSHAELAALKVASDRGDVVARIRLAELGPAAERLAEMLVKEFAGKAEPAPSAQARKQADPVFSVHSHDPREREAAWALRRKQAGS